MATFFPPVYGSSTSTNWSSPDVAAVWFHAIVRPSPAFSRAALDRLALARVSVSTAGSSPETRPLRGSSSIAVAILRPRPTERPHRLRPGMRRLARR